MKLSLVVPCYNEENNIFPFYEAVKAAFQELPEGISSYEIVFVNDGSCDETRARLHELHRADPARTAVVDFSRNFGKEAAIFAGLSHVGGDLAAIIDADLQQRPEIVVKMAEYLQENPDCDIVAAYQEKRREGKALSFFKRRFYKWMNRAAEVEFYPGASDFRLLRRKAVDAVLSMKEYFRFSKGIFSWVGFETHYMPYVAEERHTGSSKWSFVKLFKYAIEGFVSFTTFPLKLSVWLGLLVSFGSILYMIAVIIQKLCFSIDVPGYATVVVLILLLSGIQLLILGILGEYLAKTYVQGKNRPIYIEKDFLKAENDDE